MCAWNQSFTLVVFVASPRRWNKPGGDELCCCCGSMNLEFKLFAITQRGVVVFAGVEEYIPLYVSMKHKTNTLHLNF